MKFNILLFISLFIILVKSQDECRFAPGYSVNSLLNDQNTVNSFVNDVLYWEGNFNSDGAGINFKTGYTYDGSAIDYTTGLLATPLHNFSAPSKESIHLGVIARTLTRFSINGDFDMLNFFHHYVEPTEKEIKEVPELLSNSDSRLNNLLLILYRKIGTYEKFNQTFPGYGGFMPWVSVNDSGIAPLPGYWTGRVPGLDNGEMLASLYAVYNVLYENGFESLAQRYESYFLYLISTAKMVFYQVPGYITSVTQIVDIYANPTPENFYNDCICFLDDPYEGEILTVFMDLFCEWDNMTERDQLWINKRPLLQSLDFETPNGNITVQKGWWFSSHEQWKYFMLPYRDVPVNDYIFVNGEKARSWFSYINNYPGLYASVTNVTKPNTNPNYLSASGIQSLAFESIQSNDCITPYAAFPMMLCNFTTGLIWYYNTISGPSMQGPYGTTESVSIQGDLISPVLTWDSKITGLLGILGGISDINSAFLLKGGQLPRFLEVVEREWSLVFPNPIGENISFMGPPSSIPKNLNDFTTCSYESSSDGN